MLAPSLGSPIFSMFHERSGSLGTRLQSCLLQNPLVHTCSLRRRRVFERREMCWCLDPRTGSPLYTTPSRTKRTWSVCVCVCVSCTTMYVVLCVYSVESEYVPAFRCIIFQINGMPPVCAYTHTYTPTYTCAYLRIMHALDM